MNDRPWRDLTPERIRAARAGLGLSQADFALLIGRVEGRGIAPDWTKVSRWERGVRKPSALWGPAILQVVERAEKGYTEARGPQVPEWHALAPARIRAAREALRLTQADFASYLGRLRGNPPPRRNAVGMWESGAQTPGYDWGPLILHIVKYVEENHAQEGTGAGPAELAPHPEGD